MQVDLDKSFELMKQLHFSLLNFIDDQENTDEKFLQTILDKNKIKENKYYLISVLHFITKIADNHHRSNCFFNKLEKILKYLQNEIRQYLINSEIFNIFKSNYRILLFLIHENIMTIDQYIADQLKIYSKSIKYFWPEIKEFIKDEWIQDSNQVLPEDFDEKRKIGENDSQICQLIRKDSVDEFISYCKKEKYQLNSLIEYSIYETNSFLIKMERVTLIEYAAFFGSIQIFKYLRSKKVIENNSLYTYAVHGNNLEIIDLIEKNNHKMMKRYCEQYLFESLQFHNNEMTNHIKNKYFSKGKSFYIEPLIKKSLKNHNLGFIDASLINESSFFYLTQYDYPLFVDILLKTKNINVNEKVIRVVFIILV